MGEQLDSRWQRLLDGLVFWVALLIFSLLSVIDGARNPALYLGFSAVFCVLLGLLAGTCPALLRWPGRLTWFAAAGLFGLIGIAVLQAYGIGPWYSEDPLRTWQTLYLFVGYLSAFLLFTLQVRTVERATAVLWIVVLVAVAQTLFGFVNIGGGQSVLGWTPTHYAAHRVTGSFVNRNFYAGLVAMSSGYLLAWVMARPSHRRPRRSDRDSDSLRSLLPVLSGLVLALLMTGVMMSGSRSALVGFVVAFCFLLIMVCLDRGLRSGIGVLLISGFGIALFSVSIVGKRFSAARIDLGDRFQQWRITIDMLPERLLTGRGAGSYETAFSARQDGGLGPLTYNHAHNDYLQTVFELGLPGLLCAALVVFPIAIAGIFRLFSSRSITRKRGLLGALFGVLVMLTQALADFPFQVPSSVWLLLVLLAVITGLTTMERQTPGSREQR